MFQGSLAFSAEAPLQLVVTEAITNDLPSKEQNHPIDFLRDNFIFSDIAFALGTIDNDFRLLGTTWACDISMAPTNILQCRRVVRQRRWQNSDRPVTILRGAIEFVDGTLLNSQSQLILNQLREAIENPQGYLSTWDVYNDLEKQILEDKAIELGAIEYQRVTRRETMEGYEYIFDLAANAPPRLKAETIDLEAATEKFEAESEHYIFPENRVYVGEVVHGGTARQIRTQIDPETILDAPPPRGFLMHSLRGDEVRLRRRNDALVKVREAKTPLITLGVLLETGKAPSRAERHLQPLSTAVKRSLRHPPTASQKKALDIAINTPDIAIIQGPPGTGKTSVIRALMTRLSELSEKRGKQASILLSSYQHEAVDNALTGVNLMGLPPNRIGGRRDDSIEAREKGLLAWIEQHQKLCQEQLAQIGERPTWNTLKKVEQLIYQWRTVRGGADSTPLLLQDINQVVSLHLEADLLTELRQLIITFSSPHQKTETLESRYGITKLAHLERLLGDQRLDPVAFLDDGPFMASRLIHFLEGTGRIFNIEAFDALCRAAEWDTDNSTNPEELAAFLGEYKQTIKSIKSQVWDAPAADNADVIKDLEEVLTKVLMTLRLHLELGADGVAEALENFINELDDLRATRDMITQYSSVVAGTCQQVVGKNFGFSEREYEYVIIDEAARANPLDLLIPMSLGRKIILVGDHIQLPHILEEDVLEKFKKGKEQGVLDFLKTSLFERLFNQFGNKEAGIERVVTLLDDFRMHPTISQFISTTFYQGKVTPRCTIETRSHNLNLFHNRPVAWLDVPIHKGGESAGMSKSREVEVEVIKNRLQDILQANADYSIGIISFYSQQSGLLQAEIDKMPFEWGKRILVGTVDAFQGREFDIVFLSAVRSNTERANLRRQVGFLSSANRLCVALSRAKRLLVVVGDSETVAGTAAEPSVPELRTFYELCRSEEGWYERL